MIQEIIYNIRENKDIYLYLKYNSHLYKNIFRSEINIKELGKIVSTNLKPSQEDKLKNIKDKIELINTFLSILK